MDSASEKLARLQHAASQYQHELSLHAPQDQEVAAVLRNLTPLLSAIAQGRIVPPAAGLYDEQFHSEHPRYGGGTPIFSAEASFVSAILDWRSKAWFPK